MSIKIYDITINALCDSGANSTVINEKYLHNLYKKGVELKPAHMEVTTADGAVHSVKGTINVPIKWKEFNDNANILVNPIKQDMIVGMDLLVPFGIFPKRNCDIELNEIENIEYGDADDISAMYRPKTKPIFEPHELSEEDKIVLNEIKESFYVAPKEGFLPHTDKI